MNKYDLIMVGTGFASSFFLKKYLEKSSSNVRVLVLERGILYPYTERLKSERREKVNLPSPPLSPYNTFINKGQNKLWVFDPNFGGSSNCWTGCTPRFLPNDFKIKSLYGVGQDWPLSYEEIDPYYSETEAIMAIGGPEITPFPKSIAYPLPPQTLSTVDKLIQEKYKAAYISQPTARATRQVGNRNACCSSSVCKLCPVNSKFTIENTLGYLYKDPRVTLQYNCQVFSMNASNNHVGSVLYSQNETVHEVQGEVIALGANPIFNAHILLSAGDKNDFTGKGLCEQVGTYAHLYFDDLDNVGGSSIITANGYMLYDGVHRKDYAGCLIENFNNPFIRNEYGKWRKIAKLKFIFEDLPNDKNKVILGDDPLKPAIEYHGHDAYVDRAMEQLEKNIEKTFSFLPLEKIELDGFYQKSEYHICSTTRMSNKADEGVVDKNLIHHQYRNVFVLGSGSFPSITPANPTLTLSALSLRAADKSF